MKLAQNLKSLREEHGMTQSDLGDRLGLSKTQISFYESGTRMPPLSTVYQIADIFGCTMDELCGRTSIRKVG